MKFKVGDRVKFVKSIIYHTKDVKLGECYTIQEYIEKIIGLNVENGLKRKN